MNTVKSTMHHRIITITLLGLMAVRETSSAEYEFFMHPPVPGLPPNNDPTTHGTPQSTVKFPPGPPMLLNSYLAPVMQAIAYHIELLQYEPISMTTIEPPFEVTEDGSSTTSSPFGPFTTTTEKTTSNPWWQPPTTTTKPSSVIWWQPPSTTTTSPPTSTTSWWQTTKPSTTTTQQPSTLWWQTTTTQKPPTIQSTEKPTTLWWQTTTTQNPSVITTTEKPSTLWWQTPTTQKPPTIESTEKPTTLWWQTTTTKNPSVITTTEKPSTLWWQTTTTQKPPTIESTEKPTTLWWQTTTTKNPSVITTTEKPSTLWWQTTTTAKPTITTTTEKPSTPWWQTTAKPAMISTEKPSTLWWQTTTTQKPSIFTTTQKQSTLWWQTTTKPTSSIWIQPLSTTIKPTPLPWWQSTTKLTTKKPLLSEWWQTPSTTTTRKPWWDSVQASHKPTSWWQKPSSTTTQKPWWQHSPTQQRPADSWWSTTKRTTQWWDTTKPPWWQTTSTPKPFNHWWQNAPTTKPTPKPWWQNTPTPLAASTPILWESPAWAQNKPSRKPSSYTTTRTDGPSGDASIPETTPHHSPGNFAPIDPYYIRPSIAPNAETNDINNDENRISQQTPEIYFSTTSRTTTAHRSSERTTASWPFEAPSLAADSNFINWMFQGKAKKLPNDIEYDFSFLDPLPGSLIQDILKEKSELPALLDKDNINEFLRIYDDFYGRYRPTSGKKRIPPTKPYVEFLMLYDLLKREAKTLNLTNFEGYSSTIMKELAETSRRSSEVQLHILMSRMLERGDVKRPDVITRVKSIIKDLSTPSSVTAKALHLIPPLQFVP